MLRLAGRLPQRNRWSGIFAGAQSADLRAWGLQAFDGTDWVTSRRCASTTVDHATPKVLETIGLRLCRLPGGCLARGLQKGGSGGLP